MLRYCYLVNLFVASFFFLFGIISLKHDVNGTTQGVPLVYELDDNLKVIPHKDAIAPLQGRYLGDLEAVKARIAGVANQTK